MVVGEHMFAQLVKGLVVFFFFQVRQLMHHDHFEQGFWHVFKWVFRKICGYIAGGYNRRWARIARINEEMDTIGL